MNTGRETCGHAVDSSAMVCVSGKSRPDAHVELLQELDRLEVLLAAVRVGDPLAVLAPVVEVEHRGDRVHAQPVDVVLLEPEERAGGEECAHLVAAVVEDRALPVGMEAQARVGVLVEVRAVEAREPVRVVGEVRGHPVEDHADARAVQRVDQEHEVLRRAVARGRREVARGLVAPRAVERVLDDRHQLDVGEAQPCRRTRRAARRSRGRSAGRRSRCGATSRGAARRRCTAHRARSSSRASPSTRRRPTS